MPVAQVLDRLGADHHPQAAYAQIRAAINRAGRPRIFVEADALGVWCEHRIHPVTPRPGELALLDTTSETMNAYHTHVPTDDQEPPPRPTSRTPPDVLAALRASPR